MPGKKKLKRLFYVWGRAGFAAAPPHPPHPIILFLLLLLPLFLYLFLCQPPLSFSPCIPLVLVILLFCRFNLWSFSFSLSLSLSFQSFCFLVFFLFQLFSSSRLSGGGRYQKGFRPQTTPLWHVSDPFSLAPRPHPQIRPQGCDDRETQPSHPPRKSNKQLTPQNPQTRPKAPRISAPRTTLGPQQSLKGKLPPSCQLNKIRFDKDNMSQTQYE